MENHIIATASSTEQSDICIWIKPVRFYELMLSSTPNKPGCPQQSINNAARKESPGQTIVNMLILMLLLWWISSYYMLWEKVRNIAHRVSPLFILWITGNIRS